MKNYISSNIGYLVKKKSISQDDFGGLFDLKKGVINQYTQGKSLPKIETLQKICNHFELSIDDFINSDLSIGKPYSSDNNQHKIVAETTTEVELASANWKVE